MEVVKNVIRWRVVQLHILSGQQILGDFSLYHWGAKCVTQALILLHLELLPSRLEIGQNLSGWSRE
jgi:hypothetical protein